MDPNPHSNNIAVFLRSLQLFDGGDELREHVKKFEKMHLFCTVDGLCDQMVPTKKGQAIIDDGEDGDAAVRFHDFVLSDPDKYILEHCGVKLDPFGNFFCRYMKQCDPVPVVPAEAESTGFFWLAEFCLEVELFDLGGLLGNGKKLLQVGKDGILAEDYILYCIKQGICPDSLKEMIEKQKSFLSSQELKGES